MGGLQRSARLSQRSVTSIGETKTDVDREAMYLRTDFGLLPSVWRSRSLPAPPRRGAQAYCRTLTYVILGGRGGGRPRAADCDGTARRPMRLHAAARTTAC